MPRLRVQSFTGKTEGLLRHALNERALTRRFQDLKVHLRRRTLSAEQRLPP